MKNTCIPLLLITLFPPLHAQEVKPDSLPQLFEPGLISTKYPNRDIAISPDGSELFYTIQSYKREFSVIMQVKRVNGEWDEPQIAPFSGTFNDLEPAFSSDGRQLYFASNRPTSQNPQKKDHDLWVVSKQNGQWANPENLGTVINTDNNEFYPSITTEGAIYFTAEYEGGKGKEDIYVSRVQDGHYTTPVSLSESINSPTYEFNAFVAPDESYIIFSAYGREDDLGGSDLYISRKSENGEWEMARHLAAPVNSPSLDYCPYVSADGRYFFFTSNRSTVTPENTNYNVLRAQLEGIVNGFDNVYRISSEVLGLR